MMLAGQPFLAASASTVRTTPRRAAWVRMIVTDVIDGHGISVSGSGDGQNGSMARSLEAEIAAVRTR